MIHAPNLSILWGQLIVEELARLQCCHMYIASGSRNTPLTLAAARHPATHLTLGYDERSLGFCALGHARATGNPAVIIVTSGTAVANLFPAIMEASQEGIPLLILTADRPDYLRHSGDNQTVDQIKCFGDTVRWHASLPTPSDTTPARSVLVTIDKAVAHANGSHAGPVHLNVPFAKPLHPATKPFSQQVLAGLSAWQNHQAPFTQCLRPTQQHDESQLKTIAHALNTASNGLVILGGTACLKQPTIELLNRLQWPLFADMPSSGRFVQHPCQIARFDLLLDSCNLLEKYRPDVVLQLGHRTVSSHLYHFLQKRAGNTHILVQEQGLPVDAHFGVTHRLQGNICTVVGNMLQHVQPRKTASRWLAPVQQASSQIHACIDNVLSQQKKLTEPFIARCIAQHADENRALFVGNSMPIRDMTRFATTSHGFARVGANRGASGIDGIVSTACGFCQALQLPTTLVLGDLSFLHDLSGLSLLSHVKHPMTIVLVNNQGGGIFAFLPIAQQTKLVCQNELFAQCWQMKHNFNLGSLCQAFGVQHLQAATPQDFEQTYTQALQRKQHTVIEAQVDMQHNLQVQKCIQQAVKQAVKLA
ncbi:MAG: 2-succinyl-5-enolpyruvyl-6-hydroxy-3-cyclohexene-1-carboxylic-acid synthase [Myxococcota bacterium]